MDRETLRQQARQHISCAEYLEKSKGGLYCCPLCGSGYHKNGTGAVKLHDDNTWYCFRCSNSGIHEGHHADIIDLLQLLYSTDYNGALDMAAQILGQTIDTAATIDHSEKIERGNIKALPTAENLPDSGTTQAATDYSAYYRECRQRLQESPEAIDYLAYRGISADTAAKLWIGFDPEADPAQSGHKTPRIIIPTTTGHYVGRRIDNSKEYAKINVKGGTPGIFNSAALFSGAGVVYITEGAFDAMSVCEMGEAGVATNSTGNYTKLLEMLKNRPAAPSTEFVVAFDNEQNPNTIAAAESLNNGLRQLGYNSVKYNIAGGEKDANDALRADPAAFAQLLEAAKLELHRDALTDFFEKIQSDAYRPYKTELSFFDDLLGGGVIPQSLLILMAAPGTGKTTLCQQIAEAMAENHKPVIYINLEMSREQMLAKSISGRLYRCEKAQMNATQILQGYAWSASDRSAVEAELENYRQKIFPYIKYNPDNVGGDLDKLLEYLHFAGERAKMQNQQAPAVIVDYLHLISSTKGLDNAELIKQAVMGLKRYAVDYNTFVIAISATNRASNTAGRITMESGRDSSNIEYTGDYQLSLNYYAVDQGDIDPAKDTERFAELQQQTWRQMIMRVLKGRFVTPGRSARLYFNAPYNTFLGEFDRQPLEPGFVPFERPVTIPTAGKRR